jgi:phosphoglycerate dehydrogenase-like enzyme
MNILIVSPIDPDAVKILSQQNHVEDVSRVSTEKMNTLLLDCEALVFRSGIDISAEFMERAPKLKLLVRAGSGIDNIDMAYVRKRGLELARIPEPGAQAVAEMAFAFMLTMSRNLFEADRSMRQGHWIKYELESYLLKNKTLGILGVGNIGSRVGEMGVAWGMKVIGCIEHLSKERKQELEYKEIHLMEIDQVVADADYLSIHVPLKDSTRDLIDAQLLSKMKAGSYLINLARGGIVDESALLKEMTNGERIRGAALDVHKQEGAGHISPLADLPNVILTPHIGAMAIDAQREIGRRVVEIINRFKAENSYSLASQRGIRTDSLNVQLIPEVNND